MWHTLLVPALGSRVLSQPELHGETLSQRGEGNGGDEYLIPRLPGCLLLLSASSPGLQTAVTGGREAPCGLWVLSRDSQCPGTAEPLLSRTFSRLPPGPCSSFQCDFQFQNVHFVLFQSQLCIPVLSLISRPHRPSVVSFSSVSTA